ncbi:M28 family peptidase [Micromonospora krabiensis]|uniref:Aminopeptidase Y n=1 Tax=Micromonospora krabiensis TaxID=307121 RepID=A0A1C3N337_9ACTN|nr:M28 family peptidase [Micromonospora krabiensis]SBV26975.1 aminopeptidase Y [Micromonospora krabiensis]
MVSARVRRALAATVAATLVGSLTLVTPAQAGSHNNSAKKLTKAVTLKGVLRHLDAFQKIADANGGNRGSGLPGYDASADYVAGKLKKAGYTVTRQPFEFNFFEEFGSSFARTSPPPATDYVAGTDYDLMDFSGAGDVTASVVPVDLALTPPRASTSGCEASDFTSAVTGRIVLVQRGGCPFGQKVTNAEAAGAVGAILMNQGDGDPVTNVDRYALFAGTLGNPVGIPAVSVSYFLGEQLAATADLAVRITADTTSEIRATENVIAERRTGRADNVVMAGAHLDSEPDTAGINDNGTGSAALLEVALQMAKVKSNNRVRFAWWGAEEANLVGSTFYVNSLTAEQVEDLALYLNFDMIGSPNYVFGVYDGDDSAQTGAGPGPEGSAQIEDVFESFFARRGLPTNAADFTGRSDYGPFIAVGVPAGGLFTGAEVLKTAEDVAKYGGVEGAQYDPCYHDPCDSLRPVTDGADAALYAQLRSLYRLYGNVNTYALDVNADALATAVITFAYDTSAVNGVRSPGTSHGRPHGAGRSADAHGNAIR